MEDEINNEELKEFIKEAIQETFFSTEEYSPFNLLQDKINKLIKIDKYEEQIRLSEKILDKFEDYMKNLEKLDLMIREFKGLTAMVRGEAAETQKQNKKDRKRIKQLLEILAND